MRSSGSTRYSKLTKLTPISYEPRWRLDFSYPDSWIDIYHSVCISHSVLLVPKKIPHLVSCPHSLGAFYLTRLLFTSTDHPPSPYFLFLYHYPIETCHCVIEQLLGRMSAARAWIPRGVQEPILWYRTDERPGRQKRGGWRWVPWKSL